MGSTCISCLLPSYNSYSLWKNLLIILFLLLMTNTYASEATLDTTMDGGNAHNGNMFDLCALSTDIEITSFDINCYETSSATVEIYVATYESQTYASISTSSTSWTLIHKQTVSCASEGTLTLLNRFNLISIPVMIYSGDCRGFYITRIDESLSYTDGGRVGSVYASDEYIQFKEGIGKVYPFKDEAIPRIWNGRIHYTTSETLSPTTTTTTINPTQMPSDVPTYFPTLFPTNTPTHSPAHSPTNAPILFKSTKHAFSSISPLSSTPNDSDETSLYVIIACLVGVIGCLIGIIFVMYMRRMKKKGGSRFRKNETGTSNMNSPTTKSPQLDAEGIVNVEGVQMIVQFKDKESDTENSTGNNQVYM